MTSLATDGADGAYWDEMWGGVEGGSWVRTKLASNRAVYALDDPTYQLAIADLVNNQTGKVWNSGMTGTYDAYPYINDSAFCAKFAILTPTLPAYVQVFYSSSAKGTGDRSQATWAQASRARAEGNYSSLAKGGFRIPAGFEPTVLTDGTPDSDGTLEWYEPGYTWPGRAGSYPGRYSAFFGAISPAQNVALGRDERWTAKYGGIIPGAKTDLRCRSYLTSVFNGDGANTSNTEFTAPVVAQPIAGYETKTYVGFGREGIATEENAMPTAVHIPLSHTSVTRRDLTRTNPTTGAQGYIDHPIGFMLYSAPTAWKTAPHYVWPAVSYDGASRYFMPQGTMFRLPPDWIVDPSLTWQQQMLETAMRDYGIVFNDTTGSTGITFRAEAGSGSLWQYSTVPGGSRNGLMRSLPFASMLMLVPGTDTAQNPTTGGTPTAPSTPGKPSVSLAGQIVTISWSSSLNSTSYKAFRRAQGTSIWTQIASTVGLSATDQPGAGIWEYSVSGYNGLDSSKSAASDPITVSGSSPATNVAAYGRIRSA